MIWALIPLKNLTQAKQRLRSVLAPAERRQLMQAMAEDVLAVVSDHPAVAQVVLLSDDPFADELAQRYDVICWRESSLGLPPGQRTLSTIVDAAAQRLLEQNVDTMLVVHADLPQINRGEIERLIDQHQKLTQPALSIASDHRGQGTNCALLSPPNAVPAQYEGNSLARYIATAKALGVNTSSVCLPGISRDIDSPEDLDRARLDSAARGCTHRYLTKKDGNGNSGRYVTLRSLEQNTRIDDADALSLADEVLADEVLADEPFGDDRIFTRLLAEAGRLRDQGFGDSITYSRKVFLPLTQLCRDVCHYCTFAKTPKKLDSLYMTIEQVLAAAREGAELGCKEALFTLGEKPELRYSKAREALKAMGFASTLEYVAHAAERVLKETGVLPHINAGCMTGQEIALLRPVSASMGLMLESSSERLCEPGMPHFGSPDKDPKIRLRTLERAGAMRVPMTTGILIGIGETRRERVESLLALRKIHEEYGHIQEIIIQNFRRKPATKMANAPEPNLRELQWTIAVARLVFGPDMSLQAPPNLSPGGLKDIVDAGINDWGGVSPVTPDYVNPEAPWPQLQKLASDTSAAGKQLHQRLTIYPKYVLDGDTWLDPAVRTTVVRAADTAGFPRVDAWYAGAQTEPPTDAMERLQNRRSAVPGVKKLIAIVDRIKASKAPTEADLVDLFAVRGNDFAYVCEQADRLRRELNGDVVSYVVNRNINYTNVCTYKCSFCAFSKGKVQEQLRDRPYDLSHTEIARRCREAASRGATEVCLQGGIHPYYDGNTYIDILDTVKRASPDLHIHAFSPLEIWHGATTLGMSIADFLSSLKTHGLNTLPGTAAEILDDEVRAVLCPDKINTEQWLSVMRTAHELGMQTTATIMFGHVDSSRHWARHLLHIRELQVATGGFTEFVPLPFVHMASPIYLRGQSRRGPTFREGVLMHAVARIALYPHVRNIQASWVKMGSEGAMACLHAGANDLGGTLMNESITRSAGATHGQELPPETIESLITKAGRVVRQRTTAYGDVDVMKSRHAGNAEPLVPLTNNLFDSRQFKGIRPGT